MIKSNTASDSSEQFIYNTIKYPECKNKKAYF